MSVWTKEKAIEWLVHGGYELFDKTKSQGKAAGFSVPGGEERQIAIATDKKRKDTNGVTAYINRRSVGGDLYPGDGIEGVEIKNVYTKGYQAENGRAGISNAVRRNPSLNPVTNDVLRVHLRDDSSLERLMDWYQGSITAGASPVPEPPQSEGGDDREGDIGSDIDALIGDKTLDETTRKQLIDARVGQGRFRRNVIAVWGNGEQCAVTGISVRDVLVASHIRPWKSCSTHDERLAGTNGVLLAAHLDRLFDRFLISFDETGKIVISHRLTTQHRDELKTAGIDAKMNLDFAQLGTANEAEIKKMLREHHTELTRRDLQAG